MTEVSPRPGTAASVDVSADVVLEWSHVEKSWPGAGPHEQRLAIGGVSARVARGGFLALLGPSGAGKTTLLSMAAGLTRPTAGEVRHHGKAIYGVNRDVGYLTQRDTLLPWRTVQANVALPLEIRRVPRNDAAAAVHRALDLVGLLGFEAYFPRQLSGGMVRRVLLARTLVYKPSVLLFDEPFAALDTELRIALHRELLRLWEATGVSIVLVTHDVEEAVMLADRIVLLTHAPARVKREVEVDLPRPRDPLTVRSDPVFGRLCGEVWNMLFAPEGLRVHTDSVSTN